MRQKVGPLFEAMSLNHFPECHEKESLGGCLCAAVTRKGRSQPACLAHIHWHVDQRFSKCGPRSCSTSATWALVKDTNAHQPVAVLLNWQGPAVSVGRGPPGKRALATELVKVQNHWCRPRKATGAYTSEFKVTSDKTTNLSSHQYNSFSSISDLVCKFETLGMLLFEMLSPLSPPTPFCTPIFLYPLPLVPPTCPRQ